MKNLLWHIIECIDDNHGYTTTIQKRFGIGERLFVSRFKLDSTEIEVGEQVNVIENKRHDYLVKSSKTGKKYILYQFELESRD